MESSLANTVKPISAKNTKVGQEWWQGPVVLATWEAETRESLEPWRQRLQGAEIAPRHSSLGDRARLCLKKKKNLLSEELPVESKLWKPEKETTLTGDRDPDMQQWCVLLVAVEIERTGKI